MSQSVRPESKGVAEEAPNVQALSSHGVAELDDQLFYLVELKRLSSGYLLILPLVKNDQYLRYTSAVLTEQRCRVERGMQFPLEIVTSIGPYFPDRRSSVECFIGARTKRRFYVSPISDNEPVRVWLPGYVCAYGTYHLFADGFGGTNDEAQSQLADHVYEVDCQCRVLCGGSRYRLSQGKNLLYPSAKQSPTAMFRIWLRLILLLASLILAGGELSSAFLQVKHFG